MILQSLMIADSKGAPLYYRGFGTAHTDPQIFSGLIATISMIGVQLFKKEVATVQFGANPDDEQIIVITRDLFQANKHVNFVFVCTCDCEQKIFREVASAIFIEIKPLIRNDKTDGIAAIVNKIVDTRFGGLKTFSCSSK